MTPETNELALRALKTVALTKSPFLDVRERELIEGLQGRMGLALELEALELITPRELAARMPYGPARTRLVELLLLVAAADGAMDTDEGQAILGFARVLGVAHQALPAVDRLCQRPFDRLAIELDLSGPLEDSHRRVQQALLRRPAA